MLTPAQLLKGYARGVFPMAESADDDRLYWFDPPLRGVLPVGGVHASRSLLRDLKRGGWSAHTDGFHAVVAACADRETTWINAELTDLYYKLHEAGHAHAISILHDGHLAGGIFGVTLGSAFFGESMVSQRTSGSKMALLWASHHLRRCGFTLFDTQFLTPHLARMGGTELPRSAYRVRLAAALRRKADFTAHLLPSAHQLWQDISQTS
ncbi:leucyl/phenylalanyl-tRNA--protein transferase [Paracoccus beibuensis]|uniref:leucyl/phenylalanyl-tRNA--protein transferase n=1 Tax=Paracoccus beibuensis TaxID=547602 RepID=UPI002240594F|nr:leucyl/phenylalanyl-tRNA--protein transferase [Paracoccus beibuensis]